MLMPRQQSGEFKPQNADLMAKRQTMQREKLKSTFFGVKQDAGAQYAE